MKKMIKSDVVEQLLRKFNPFGLRTKQGVPYEFLRLSEVYLHVMIKVYSLFPRGYIETALLVSELYAHLSFNECKGIARYMKPMGIDEVNLVDYRSKEAKDFFERLCKALHSICETAFASSDFSEAYRLFQNRMELEKIKNNGKEN